MIAAVISMRHMKANVSAIPNAVAELTDEVLQAIGIMPTVHRSFAIDAERQPQSEPTLLG